MNLPEVKLTFQASLPFKYDLPIFKRKSNNSINTYSIEMHPKRFGKITNQPFKRDCEAIWKSVLDY